MPRGVEAKSVTENSSDEYESIVGRDCYPDNKNLTVCTAAVTVGWTLSDNKSTT